MSRVCEYCDGSQEIRFDRNMDGYYCIECREGIGRHDE